MTECDDVIRGPPFQTCHGPTNSKGGFTQNPVTAYDPAYGQRQSSHELRWPYPGEFSRFRPASSLLKIVLHVERLPLAISRIVGRNRILCEAALSLPLLSTLCVSQPSRVLSLFDCNLTRHSLSLMFLRLCPVVALSVLYSTVSMRNLTFLQLLTALS